MGYEGVVICSIHSSRALPLLNLILLAGSAFNQPMRSVRLV
jgi:hypothetical protein